MNVWLLLWGVVVTCRRVGGYNNAEWKFTTLPFTSSRATVPPVSPSQESGPANLVMSLCSLPGTCEDPAPVCGSNCRIYPDACYMRYVGCLQNETLTPHPLTYCTELRPLKLDPLPTTLNVLYGQNVILQCKLSEGSGIPVEVSWYELNTKGRHELKSGATEDSYTLNVTDIRGDRYFFCQVSNCKGEIEQSSTVKVTIPQNLCLLYGPGHVRTFTQDSYSYQTDCTHVAAMDTRRAKWFIYVRYQSTWQIATPSLSTVTIYYNHIPLEIQRGWLVNYFGTKVVVREGETKEMFDMTLTFDGLYMTVTTPEVTLHWDGLGSLIIGVSPDTQTLGLCGSNREGEALRPRFKRRRSYLQASNEASAVPISTVVKSWSLGRGCRYEDDIVSQRFGNVPQQVSQICDILDTSHIPRILRKFYNDGCEKDNTFSDMMAGSTPVYCFTQLAVYHLRDKLSGTIHTDLSEEVSACALSVLKRQYLAYYAGCPNPTPPFDVT